MATDGVGQFDLYMRKASTYHEKALWQEKLRALLAARECIVEGFPDAEKRTQQVLTEIGGVRRRFGQYEEGVKTLNLALDVYPQASSGTQAQILGEMGVLYRLMNDFEKAFQTFRKQFDLASEIDTQEGEIETCRAIGNAGVSAYNLSLRQEPYDETLMHTAIEYLQKRIDRAHKLFDRLAVEEPESRYVGISRSWQIIGMNRLALCYIATGRTDEAVSLTEESQIIETNNEPTVRAFSRFYHGNSLWSNGQHDEAIAQWNTEPGTCSPAAALCKEPSAEHVEFLKRLVEAGVDLSSYDEQGFSALDYAVLSDTEDAKQMIAIIVDCFRERLQKTSPDLTSDQVNEQIQRRLEQAHLRRNYRAILQEDIRPELRNIEFGSLHNVRRIYADILANDATKQELLDEFYFVPYNDFKLLGRLPILEELRAGGREQLAKRVCKQTASSPENDNLHIIFFSYRWIGIHSEPPVYGPDDNQHTQYRRMMNAVETYVKRKRLDPDNVGVWVDFACIDQANKTVRERGINALPLAVIQCNTMISLMDEEYWNRAWCAVEVRLMRELLRSYHMYDWWEHRLHSKTDPPNGILVPGNWQRDVDVSKMNLTEERSDRPKIDFLLRQSKLIGRDDA